MQTDTIKGMLGALALVLGLTLDTAAHANQGQSWEFEVLLNDRKIGYHSFDLETLDGRQVLQTAADFKVRFLFINAFRYQHRNTEIWSDNCLESIDAVTDYNGDDLFVRGEKDGGDFTVASTNQREALDGCVRTFAYWNPAILDEQRLLNSQTGEYEEVSVTLEGPDSVEVGDETVAAVRYTLESPAGDIKLWYARDDLRWLALEAPAEGGRTIRYRPLSVPEGLPEPLLLASNR